MAKSNANGTHETLSRDEGLRVGSDRSFGILFTVVLAILGCLPLLSGGGIRAWSLGLSSVFLILALVAPRVLHPLNVLWMKFGLMLNKAVSPVVLGLLFFVTITPMALLMRLMGKDPLRLRRDPDAKSYWITRDPPGPPPDSMKNQF